MAFPFAAHGHVAIVSNLYGIAGPSYCSFTNLPGSGAQQNPDDALGEFFDFDKAAMDLSTREPSMPKSNHEASARDEATKLPSLQQCSDHSTPDSTDAVPYTPGLEYPDSGVLQKDFIGPNPESHECIGSDQQLEKFRVRKRSASPISIPGYQCRDWNIMPQLGPQPRKRPKTKTGTQREEANRVREKGACLRCYVQKLKCSEGVPCAPCANLLSEAATAVRTRTLQWTACISSSLLDVNVFTYGIALVDDPPTSSAGVQLGAKKAFGPTSMTLFDMVLSTATMGGKYSFFSKFDSLYSEVVRHIYGSHVEDVHTFILEDRNPLNVLIQFNTVLLGSQAIGDRLGGYYGYLRKVRGICGELAFQGLEKCLERNHLAGSSPTRQFTLIVYIALVLEQVLEIEGGRPGSLSTSSDSTYQAMHNHLAQYLFYYLRRLCSNIFLGGSAVMGCIENTPEGVHIRDSFWCELSQATGCGYLQKPPKLQEYIHLRNDFVDEYLRQ